MAVAAALGLTWAGAAEDPPRPERDVDGRPPLVAAVRAGDSARVAGLLESGADAAATDTGGQDALMLAARLGDEGAARTLLDHGARPTRANRKGLTALMLAAAGGHAEVARLLATRGAEVEARDLGGHTALMLAANNGHVPAVQALLARGADTAARNHAGQTAAMLAEENGYGEVVALLRPSDPAGLRGRPAPSPNAAPAADLFDRAPRAAWRFVNAHYQPATGLVSAVAGYPFATVWDIGSAVAALYCARELGLVTAPVYEARLRRLLRTLVTLPLFDGAAFNRSYSTRTAGMAGAARTGRRGDGWSATDIGRLLLWLKIVAVNQPEHAAEAEAVVRRLDVSRLTRDGYLRGFRHDAGGQPLSYQEGRVGYEQYAAAGYAAWGFPVERALGLERNAIPLSVMGRPLAADARGFDRLTSEPVILTGMEVGWKPEERALAEALLSAQEERYRRTGLVTMVSEDAIGRPPHYFYYYCVYTNARHFALDVQDPTASVSGPRWVSTKAAFAWHALLPGDYTARALAALAHAQTPLGWASGVYEASGRSTGTANVNTQAVILEAALYRKRGRPFLERQP